jgi:hypothetical protein
MAISFVNGYVCTSCSDVSKAKQGENPHPTTDATKNAAQKKDAASGDSRPMHRRAQRPVDP